MATFTAEQPYGNAPSITYNQAITYNNSAYTYNGQLITIWTAETKNN